MNKIDSNVYDDLQLLPFDLTGWGGDDPFFEKIICQQKPKTIIEIGSWKGQSTITMGTALKKHDLLDSKIFCIDTWLGSLEFYTYYANTPERNLIAKNGYPQIYYQFLSNVVHSGLQEIIIPVPNTSQIGLKILKNQNINPDLIYIDASHEEDDVYQDLLASWNYMRQGIVFGDDHAWQGVLNAIDRFSKDYQIKYKIDGRFWIFDKT
jgi:predicted O-methyltransferase YrrM